MKQIFTIAFAILSTVSVRCQFDEVVWEKVIFDSASTYISIDTSQNNIWQLGEPKKSFFDSAFSKGVCLVTDTLMAYPSNNHSHFDLVLGDFNHQGFYYYDIFVKFKHKFDTDTLRDGCNINVSYDKGETWIDILEDKNSDFNPAEANSNLYNSDDSLANGLFGFSGKSDGWITTSFGWGYYPASLKSTKMDIDTIILRFNFYSDSIDNSKEGWLIDNITFYTVDLGGGAVNDNTFDLIKVYPNPAVDNISIEFDKTYNDISLEILSLKGAIYQMTHYQKTNDIELHNLNLDNGVYILKITLDDKVSFTRTILIEN